MRREQAPARKAVILGGLLSLAFLLADFFLLKALPRLNVSYGPAAFSLFALGCVRLVIWAAWAILSLSRPGLRRKPAGGILALGLLHALVSGLVVDAFVIEPFRLQTTYLVEPAESILPGRTLRIVQLSDLHVERTTRRESELVQRVRELQPDIVVWTGDYLNLSYMDDPQTLHDAQQALAQIDAPYGVYAISGSIETPDNIHEIFRGTKAVILNDAVRIVETPAGKLALVGVFNYNQNRDADALQRLAGQVPQGITSLLLYHTPDLAEAARQAGIDFYLAGHTHGGQIRLPFYGALITFSRYGKEYEAGLYDLGSTLLYVSRGIGMEGSFAPRARLLCPPQIVVLDLVAREE